MKKDVKKWLLTILLHGLFIIGICLYLSWVKNSFNPSSSVYEAKVFMCFLFAVIALAVLIGPYHEILPCTMISALFTLYYVAQSVYFRAFHQYFRFSTALSLGNEAVDSAKSIVELIKFSDFVPFFVLLAMGFIFVLLYKMVSGKKPKFVLRLGLQVVLTIPFIILSLANFKSFQSILAENTEEDPFLIYKSDFYVYDSIPSSLQFVDTFGLTTFLFRDAEATFAKQKDSETYLADIEQYMNAKQPFTANEYTGLFANKSLFIIQAESLMNMAIDAELTPTLYKMMTEGFQIEGFNTPLLAGSTSDTEFMANTSIIPESEGYACAYRFEKNEYPVTLAKMFNDNGFYSQAIHNNYGEFYNRTNFFADLGYDFFDSYRVGVESEEIDSKVLDIMKWSMIEGERMYSFWITFNGHQPYDMNYPEEITQYAAEIKAKYPELPQEYVSYFCKTMDLDRALGRMLEDLEYAGKSEEMVFVIFGDHFAKGLADNSQVAEVLRIMGKEDMNDPAVTPMIIYNPGQQPQVIHKVSTALDILPTIANLWGFELDSKQVMGSDIFDSTYEGVYFSDYGTYQTNNFRYDVISDTFQADTDYSKEEALKDVAEIQQLRDISKKILKTDYFALEAK